MSKLLPHEKTYLKKLITHIPDNCEGQYCCVHNPSQHHMREWEMNFRFDKGVMERICPEHGVGHPDPDDAAYWVREGKPEMTIHGCCGCCSKTPDMDDQQMQCKEPTIRDLETEAGLLNKNNFDKRVKWVNALRNIVGLKLPKNKSGVALVSDVDLILASDEDRLAALEKIK